jgi:hypothetical protein
VSDDSGCNRFEPAVLALETGRYSAAPGQ